MMRIIKWVFVLFFLFGVMLGIIAVNGFESSATVSPSAELTRGELKRVKRFIQINNPMKLRSGQTASNQISQQDLNLLLSYISQKASGTLVRSASSHTVLNENHADVQLSLRLPENPLGQYINISTQLETVKYTQNNKGDEYLKLKSIRVGSLKFPAFITEPVAGYAHVLLQNNIPEYKLVSQSIQNIHIEKKKLTVSYVWDGQTVDNLKTKLSSRVIPDELRRALIAQSNNLSKISYRLSSRPTLNELIGPMFKLAESRSMLNDPVIENKAVFITLGAYSLNKNISKLFDKKDQTKIKTKKIYLKNRFDLSRHFLVSAAITSLADSSLAESIGLEKEMKDSEGGSGFSFSDLAADHAGIRLAEYSISNEQHARKVQTKLASIKYEGDYMPAIDNLPDGLSRQEFNRKYANTAEYESKEQLIKRRIDQLVIYK